MSEKTAKKRATSRTEMSKLQWTLKEMKRNWPAYLMVAPYMLIFTCFTVIPVVLSMFMSITDFNMLQVPNIVWLDNYIRLFLDDDILDLGVVAGSNGGDDSVGILSLDLNAAVQVAVLVVHVDDGL